ncbi:outer membrane protein OmpA [Fulvivirga imtechensis AK7]|uniref:Outer membrane protein OmpA n=1 Tax=Fulvivirga imtechensis AK7 TaxID=1237149 RepID=L8JMZ4_9BACT|nr:OmpA family protein [Fulvivirga imtechensis]ELR70286.1 outer membrane protein OmpA [Fulvivirga imtechensis AK7]
MLSTLKIIRFVQTAVFTLASHEVFCQHNLVPNYDFEEIEFCPVTFSLNSGDSPLEYWYSPSEGTPDVFHHCSEINGVPVNFAGVASPQSGKSYAGIYLAAKTGNYKEYLAIKLLKPLSRGIYRFRAYLRLASYSGYKVDLLHLGLSKDPISIRSAGELPAHKFSNFFSINISEVTSGKWHLVEASFIAHGGEEFITLGNFEYNNDMVLTPAAAAHRKSKVNNFAFYYFDNLLLVEDITFWATSFRNRKRFTLTSVYFDHDKYQLSKEGVDSLVELAGFLKINSHLSLKIYGYADSTGSESYNMRLSNLRAIEVKNHLISKGISGHKITVLPMGELADNVSPENSRRVEFEFIE